MAGPTSVGVAVKGLKVAAAALITVATGTGLVIHRAGAEVPSGSWLTAITPCRLIDTRPGARPRRRARHGRSGPARWSPSP